MVQGKCPQCGQLYFGKALLHPNNEYCECGMMLAITESDKECMREYIQSLITKEQKCKEDKITA